MGLFSSFFRVFLKLLRKTFGHQWLKDKVPIHWYGVKGRPSSQAACSRLIAARYAKATGATAICILYDVTKASDHLDWRTIVQAAVALEFPLLILRFLICLYSLSRDVVIGRGIIRSSRPVRSVVAGCTFADIMMFLVMRIINEKV